MKKLLLPMIFMAVSLVQAIGQSLPVDTETKKVTFQETVVLDSVSRDDIYQRSKDWIAGFYKTDKFTPDDMANYKVGKDGFFVIYLTYDFKYKSENNVSYTIVINQKEGKYRYTITDFTIYNVKTGPKTAQALEVAMAKMSGQNKTEVNNQINKEVAALVEDLKKFMKVGKAENKDDW